MHLHRPITRALRLEFANARDVFGVGEDFSDTH